MIREKLLKKVKWKSILKHIIPVVAIYIVIFFGMWVGELPKKTQRAKDFIRSQVIYSAEHNKTKSNSYELDGKKIYFKKQGMFLIFNFKELPSIYDRLRKTEFENFKICQGETVTVIKEDNKVQHFIICGKKRFFINEYNFIKENDNLYIFTSFPKLKKGEYIEKSR